MLIAMAGLPGTGKSTLAGRLKLELGAVVLNKDEVRAVLFPPPVLDYSAVQDDVCMAAIYGATAVILRTFPRQAVILDGRSFSRAYQVRDLMALAASLNETPRIIECVCDDEVARERLEGDWWGETIRQGTAPTRFTWMQGGGGTDCRAPTRSRHEKNVVKGVRKALYRRSQKHRLVRGTVHCAPIVLSLYYRELEWRLQRGWLLQFHVFLAKHLE